MREPTIREQQPSSANIYQRLNPEITEAKLGYLLTTEKLLDLDPESSLSFVDVVSSMPADEVVDKLKRTRIGNELISADDTQLGLQHGDDYLPELDVTKSQSRLIGTAVRVWGWKSEGLISRNLDVELFYLQESEPFSEVIGLSVNSAGHISASGSIVMPQYAEQGYEGHNFRSMYKLTDEDVEEFTNFVNQVVGESPESYRMRQERLLQQIIEKASTDEVRAAIQLLIDRTWPAQALHVLRSKQEGMDASIAAMSADPSRSEEAVYAITRFLNEWNFPPLP